MLLLNAVLIWYADIVVELWQYPCSFGGSVRIFGHGHYGDDEVDDRRSHTSHKVLEMTTQKTNA